MKKRHLYAILFGLPGLTAALLLAFAVFGTLAGMLWIYVFGDDPWPRAAERLLAMAFTVVFLALWLATIVAGYRTGRRLEATPGVDRHHLLLSAGATLLPLALILLHQYGVGNIGPVSDTGRCSDFCGARGYAGSGMPPRDSGDRTCSCYDAGGRVALTRMLPPRAGD